MNGAQALTITAGGGDVSFGALVGGTTPLASLTVSSRGTTTINTTAITTAGLQDYAGAMTLGADVSLTTTDSDVSIGSTIDGTVNGAQSLTINYGTGTVDFGGAVEDPCPPH